MDRRDDQGVGTQPGSQEPDVARQLAELDRVVAGVRESLERLRASAQLGGENPGPAGEAGGEEREAPPAPAEPGGGAGDEGETSRTAAGEEPAEQAAPAPEEAEGREAAPEEGEAPQEPEAGAGGKETVALFEGSADSMRSWKTVGSGECEYRDEWLQLRSGRDRGLAYYTARRFDDFRLRAQYRLGGPETPASAAVRFLDPEEPVPDRENPERKYRYDNQAYVAAHTGFEVHLGAGGDGEPGTLVGIPVGDEPGQQRRGASAEPKQDGWNELDLEVRGNDYTVRLNGVETARFTNTDPWRGKPARAGSEAGFVGFVMGEQPRSAHRGAPAVRSPLAGPLVPGRPGRGARGGTAPGPEAPAFDLALRRVEVEVLEAAPAGERLGKLSRKELAALHAEVQGALARLKAKDPGLEKRLQQAYGYAVLPAVGRAGLLLGGARGYGEVFEKGKPIGYTRMTQVTFGVQVGGQTFTKLILFGSKESLDAFKASPRAFNGNLSAVFIRGASGTTDFKDVTAHAYSRGGMLLEASLGGQKFQFVPREEMAREFEKPRAATEARAKIGQAGRAAKGVAGKVASKVGGVLKKGASE